MDEQQQQQINELKARVVELAKSINTNLWAVGDALVELTDTLGQTLSSVFAEGELPWSMARLCEIRNTARAFPVGARDTLKCFYDHELATTSAKRVAREIAKKTGQVSTPDFGEALNVVAKLPRKRKRDATSTLAKIAAEKMRPRQEREALLVSLKNDGLLDHCYLRSNEDILEKVADGSAKMIHLDPPYACYRKRRDGALDRSTSVTQNAAANTTNEDGMRTTVATIRKAAPKLAPGGVLLLWQTARELRAEILAAIYESGLEIEILVTWDKKRPQPQDFTSAYAIQSESLWVIKRKGDALLEHTQGLARGNVFEFAPVHHDSASLDERHFWEKPAEMMEFLVKKHTSENDLVLDLFGCTGSLSCACIRLNRRWIYCELMEENFARGQDRIAQELGKRAQPKLTA